MSSAEPAALGLIAGLGRLPIDVARSALQRGRRVEVVAFRGLADRRIEREVSQVTWVHPGQVGSVIQALQTGGIREAVLAGKVPKSTLYGDPASLRLDERAIGLIKRLADRRDDSILALVADVLAEEGIRLLPQTDLVPQLLAVEGVLGTVEPSDEQLADVAFGWSVAKALGSFDIGQTVVVKDRAVLALEAVEGTDAAIRRGGSIATGVSVIKVAKPDQDPRFDLPTIGPDTLDVLLESGAKLLAVEAGQTLILERERIVALADSAGIALLGVVAARLPEVSK